MLASIRTRRRQSGQPFGNRARTSGLVSVGKIRCLVSAAVALAYATPAMPTVLLHEGFDISAQVPRQAGCNISDFPGGPGTYPFPDGWLLRNVDARTPNAAVAWVNDAWEVREDFAVLNSNNCVAFSTSYYDPAGAADDWMWTPAVAIPAQGAQLSWRAEAYDPAFTDGYEVRVMVSPLTPAGGTGVLGNQVSASTQVFSTPAEATTWTTHTVDLAAYAGATIYVGFRNNSNDKFLLVVDDVDITDRVPNLRAQAGPGFNVDYVKVPTGLPAAAHFGVTASNTGLPALHAVVADVTVKRDGIAQGASSPSATVASLAGGSSAPLAFAGDPAALNGDGVWSFRYELSATETPSETDTSDNVLEVPGVTIGGNEWTRYAGPASGTIGSGGAQAYFGTQFTLTQAATFEGVRFGFGDVPPPPPPAVDTWPGQSVYAMLWATAASGKPSEVIATTTTIKTTTIGSVYDVWFTDGPQTLPAGTWVVTVADPGGPPAMPLLVASDRYVPGTTWVFSYEPNSPYFYTWVHFEDYGAQFAHAPYISLLTYVTLFKDGFDGPSSTGTAASTASAGRSASTRRATAALSEALPRR